MEMESHEDVRSIENQVSSFTSPATVHSTSLLVPETVLGVCVVVSTREGSGEQVLREVAQAAGASVTLPGVLHRGTRAPEYLDG